MLLRASRWSLAGLFPFVCLSAAVGFAACSDPPPTPPAPDPDTGTVTDTGTKDTAVADTAKPDTAPADTGATDTAKADTADTIETCALPFSTKLSEMSLYSNFKTRTVAAINVEFKPTHELWSDGAAKKRWISIPAGKKIDSSDIDQWDFPICTRLWKEFSKDGKIIETRLWQRTGKDEYLFGAYAWNDAQTEATWTLDGVDNALGTTHDIPNLAACLRCHEGVKGRSLGFGAVQLAKSPGLDLAGVNAKGWLTNPPITGKDYGIPGNPTEVAALGWLNANCGHCHNPNSATTWAQTDMVLRIYPLEGAPADTKLYKTSVGVLNMSFKPTAGPFVRIEPGVPLSSTLYVRDATRDGASVQMPPIASEVVHTEGLAAVKAWIESMPKTIKPDAGADGSSTDAASDGG